MIISPKDAIQLPLHDATILMFNVVPATGGFLEVTLRIRINPEEPVHPLRELGIKSSDLDLVFTRCWQVKVNLLGYATLPEVISTFDLEEHSALIKNLLGRGLGSQTMVHFTFEGSLGSRMDLIAETFSIIER